MEKANYGIICVTKENINKPWLNFEAGALSRSIEKLTATPFAAAVSPFLFDLKSSDLQGPLTQFQYAVNEKPDIFKLIASMNNKLGANQLLPDKLERAYELWWPELNKDLTKIASENVHKAGPTPQARKPEVILEELLELARTQQRLAISKDDLLSVLNTLRFDLEGLRSGGIFGNPIIGGPGVGFRNSLGRAGFVNPNVLYTSVALDPAIESAVKATASSAESNSSTEGDKKEPNPDKD